MKKKIISIVLLIVLSVSFVYMAVGCVSHFLPNASEEKYFEYTEKNNKMYIRGIVGISGSEGWILLDGKKISAEFEPTFKGNLLIRIRREDVPDYYYITPPFDREVEYVTDIICIGDLNKNDQLVGTNEEVELFDEKFERIVLTLNRLDADDFDAWEYGTRWKSDTSDDYTVLNFYSRTPIWWNTDKCVLISVKKSADAQEEYYIFKWLPEEKGFEIYVRENDEQYTPQEGQEPVSTGTYEKKGEKFNETVTLTFTTDGIFDGKYPTLELVRKY